jgi:hypothetical protein
METISMQKNKSKKTLHGLILAIIIIDLVASYFCFLQTPLLGDLANIVLPSPEYSPILSDPLGINLLITGEKHVGPNRFFAHWLPYTYFNNVPFFFQYFTNPIDSVYMSCAILKLGNHLGITYILTRWIVRKTAVLDENFLFIFALISSMSLASPYGFFFPMRIIDQSIIYTFAYSFSFLFLLLYMHPFVNMYLGNRSIKLQWWEHLYLWSLSFVVMFNGPINAPNAILLSGLSLLALWGHYLKQQDNSYTINGLWRAVQAIPTTILFHFSWLILLGLYSFYLGTFNSEIAQEIPSILERYQLLWQGIIKVFFIVKTTPLPLIGLTAIAFFFLNKNHKSAAFKKLLFITKCISCFAGIYILLLPLGGYRPYRNLILRFDTMLPISFGIFILFGASVHLLLKELSPQNSKKLKIGIIGLVSIVTFIDSISLYPIRNTCERSTLFQLSEATKEPVLIPDCSIMSWSPITPTKEISREAQLFYRWNITKKPLIYYHKK